MPQNTIRDFAFDNNGYLWIATDDGIVKYDGNNSITYNVLNSDIKKNRILYFIKTLDKKIYFFDEADNLYEIENNDYQKQIVLKYQFGVLNFSRLYLNGLKNLEEIITSYKMMSQHLKKATSITNYFLTSKKYYALSVIDSLKIFTYKNQYVKSIYIPNVENQYLFSTSDNLFLATNKGIFYKIKLEKGVLEKINFKMPSGQLVWNSKTDEKFWLCENGVFEITSVGDLFKSYKICSQIEGAKITRLTYSLHKELLLIGTNNNGLYFYKKKKFDIIKNLSKNYCMYSQVYLPKYKSIFANNCQLVNLKDTKALLPINQYAIYSSSTDTVDNVYLSSASNLFKFNLSTNKLQDEFKLLEPIPLGIQVIYNIDNKRLLLCSGCSLWLYNTEDKKTHKLGDFNYPNEKFSSYCILKKTDSIYLIGTENGIYEYDFAKQLMQLKYLPGIIVRSLFTTSTGMTLAGTYGMGYYAITKDKTIKIPLDKFENLKATHSFIEDKNGFIWMSTNNGMYKIKLKAIENYIAHPNSNPLYYFRYSDEDGLATNEFNGGCSPSVVQMENGQYSLPSMQGLVWFKPDSLTDEMDNYPLTILKLVLDNLPFPLKSNEISLPNHHFKLDIFLATPHWTDEQNLYTEYCLQVGQDSSNWIAIKNINEAIVLQNLPGGQHKILFRKKTGSAANQYNYLTLNIQVPKLLREYTWFWPLTIMLILVAIYGSAKLATLVISRQREHLKKIVNEKTMSLQQAMHDLENQNMAIKQSENTLMKENKLKNTLLNVISHDIASPLRFINHYLSRYANLKSKEQINLDDLTDLNISATTLENLLENIVTFIKHSQDKNIQFNIKKIHLYELINEKIRLFHVANVKKKNNVLNKINATSTIETDDFILSMAIQNILGNATNYTSQGNITIYQQDTTTHYNIVIEDSGMHRKNEISDTENNHQILLGYGIGLQVTKELLKTIQGEILFLSTQMGSVATIKIQK